MLSLEEYISKRKKEDRINEFDIESKAQNMQTCMNYIFEYFNQYLDDSKLDEKTVLNEERLEKYKNSLRQYESDIQEWCWNL
ncbi:argonaute-like protein implicated in RNA metabolism and viral defense [Robertmurraya andreesenii]|uniref:Argonaute-like protein implicated in RNA metabolism and viral defense n=1 Tax=Anoxybacillus andreesenii TaxID=1325932 RepID=A0ABT9V9B0_9BACL|nr:argonaute-like protein implicated in RNA metabolism and viral defense [Robertmurraya andreesenii]